jgi:hypothetical protein
MPVRLRRWVSELMTYDADDKLSVDEAEEFLESHKYGAWTVDAKGIRGVGELSDALNGYGNLEQLSFCTHGFPGGVYFQHGSLVTGNLRRVIIHPNLFRSVGRLLFMGCETARGKAGEDFLVAAGRHFLAGKGGTVGGTTIYNLGWSSGSRLPVLGRSHGGWEGGKLVVFYLDAKGNVTDSKSVRPFGL